MMLVIRDFIKWEGFDFEIIILQLQEFLRDEKNAKLAKAVEKEVEKIIEVIGDEEDEGSFNVF